MTQQPLLVDADLLRARLLAWYNAHARTLPWRVGPADRAPGERPDPYRVWLSEVMLQQTTVPHATPYFLEFTLRWPTVQALAAADDGSVMGAWAGLGYYARARNLLACARAVAQAHGGEFPDTEAGLRTLPGVGAYTAAAVAAIAFGQPASVVDGNVERVIARLHAVQTPLPDCKPELARLAGALVAGEAALRPGDWAQALMDLGATICRPKSPLCDRCPAAELCAGRATGAPDAYPRRRSKAERPTRQGIAFVRFRDGAVALVRRPDKGLLGGMLGLPTSPWIRNPAEMGDALASAGAAGAEWRDLGSIRHVFTHFALELQVLRAEGEAREGTGNGLIWLPVDEAAQVLPSVFRKALARATALL